MTPRLLLPALLIAAALPWPAMAATDELQALRDANARLQQQVEQLQQQCAIPAAAASAASAPTATAAAAPRPAAAIAATELPYTSTGCRKGKGGSDLRWKERSNWEDLARGMSVTEVEERLGIEHFNVADGTRTGWQYGKCEASVRGTVVFEQGRVLFWDMPTF